MRRRPRKCSEAQSLVNLVCLAIQHAHSSASGNERAVKHFSSAATISSSDQRENQDWTFRDGSVI
jgi:hypothetical protein